LVDSAGDGFARLPCVTDPAINTRVFFDRSAFAQHAGNDRNNRRFLLGRRRSPHDVNLRERIDFWGRFGH
jgi:hypothetical protein